MNGRSDLRTWWGLGPHDWLMFLSIVGYPLVAGVSAVVGLGDSSALSIVVRLATAALGIHCFVLAMRTMPFSALQRIFFGAYLAFWTLYLLRIISVAYFENTILPWSGTEYIGYSLIFSILPSLGAIFITEFRSNVTRLLTALSYGFMIALASNLYQFFKDAAETALLTGGRAQSEKLNPISMGIMAANALIVLYVMWRDAQLQTRMLKFMTLPIIALAATGLIMSGSKGPALAFLLSVFLYHFFPFNPARLIKVIGASVIFLIITGFAAYQLNNIIEINLINRFIDLLSGTNADQSSLERLSAYRAAWEQIQNHPWLGSALVENSLHYYPHNIVLEILLATGTVGLLVILFAVWAAVLNFYRIMNNADKHRWMALLLFQAMISAMFSGGIHMASQFWFLIVGCMFTATGFRSQNARTARQHAF